MGSPIEKVSAKKTSAIINIIVKNLFNIFIGIPHIYKRYAYLAGQIEKPHAVTCKNRKFFYPLPIKKAVNIHYPHTDVAKEK